MTDSATDTPDPSKPKAKLGTLRALWPFVRLFVRQLAIIYAVSALGITAIALAAIYAITRSAPNALALAVLAGLWLSLWLAPGIASFTTWRQLHGAELKRDR